jgi:multidrug resistance efflux pump
MARTKSGGGNGRVDRLEEAMAALGQAQANLVQAQANLVQNQAALAQNQTAFIARMAEIDARMAETNRINSERFARIEAILMEHSRILRALPDAIRDKIGFKSPTPQAGE